MSLVDHLQSDEGGPLLEQEVLPRLEQQVHGLVQQQGPRDLNHLLLVSVELVSS